MFPVITGKTGRERIYDGYPDVARKMIDSRIRVAAAPASTIRRMTASRAQSTRDEAPAGR
jgi:hypothetical protein